MTPRGRPPKQKLGFFNSERFLRSINLAFDINVPERVAHFQPTSKSAILFASILGLRKGRSFLVIAPYGSGKSITATAAVHLLENRESALKTLEEFSPRWRGVDTELYRFSSERITMSSHVKGLAITLSGYAPNLAEALIVSLRMALARGGGRKSERFLGSLIGLGISEVLRRFQDFLPRLIEYGVDRIAIVWDEFGRHLDGIVESGETASLDDVQILAEFASRYSKIPLTFSVLMHQSFLNYAINLPQASKREWKKIEGRFETIQYVDDSKEIYRLVSQIAAKQSRIKPESSSIKKQVTAIMELGIFGACSSREIEEMITSSYPMEPFTLFLLPRVSARVSQNERTVFSYIYEKVSTVILGPDSIYDYFSESMRADTALGGTYRQWLETQSALSKSNDELEVKVLKTACLLGLGLSGERSRCTRAMLIQAVAGFQNHDNAIKVIDSLLNRKLLLYRKNKDSISIWHGADIDLRSRLDEEKNSQAPFFDVIDYINKDFKPEPQKPLRYNSQYAITRYFDARYISYRELKNIVSTDIFKLLPVDSDGYIYLIVLKNDEERNETIDLIKSLGRISTRVVFCVPDKYRDIFDLSLETYCLKRLSQDHFLLNEDPMIGPELNTMLVDAQAYLFNLLKKIYGPRKDGAVWFSGKKSISIMTMQHLRDFLSETMKKAYGMTPHICNEMFVRKSLRQNLINSRRKFIFALLEHYGESDLGLTGCTPDVSLFRTTLLNTGLYRERTNGRWSFAEPEEIEDKGLREVWTLIQTFFTLPSENPKYLYELFHLLLSEPFGIRLALFPVFVAAGYKAFSQSIEIKRNGEYLPDILPSTIEEMCSQPELYSFMVYGLDEKKKTYLRQLISLFSENSSIRIGEHELLRSAFDSLNTWRLKLPPAALEIKLEQQDASSLQGLLRKNHDPFNLFIHLIPSLFAADGLDESIMERIKLAKRHLEEVQITMYNQASLAFAAAFELEINDITELTRKLRIWIDSLPAGIEASCTDEFLKGFITRIKINYQNTESLLNSIASYLVGSTIERWGEKQIKEFRIKLQIARDGVEEKALILASGASFSEKELALKLLEARLIRIKQQLIQIGDEVSMKQLFSQVMSGGDV